MMDTVLIITEAFLGLGTLVFLLGAYKALSFYTTLPKSPFTRILRDLGISLLIGATSLIFWLFYLLTGSTMLAGGTIVGVLIIAFFLSYILAVALGLRQTLNTVEALTEEWGTKKE